MRYGFILLLTAICMHFGAAAQQENTAKSAPVFTYVEQMPEFPGGTDSLFRYLAANIRYPDSARLLGVEGRVYVKFIVSEKGNVDSVRVLRGIGYGCDGEAARVIRNMPRWKPGHQDGKPVKVYFTLPITYRLEDRYPAADSATHH